MPVLRTLLDLRYLLRPTTPAATSHVVVDSTGAVSTRLPLAPSTVAGYRGWAYDSACVASSVAVTAGRVNLSRIIIDSPGTINTIYVAVATAGASPTAGQCAAVLYDATGAQIGITGDIGTQLTSAVLVGMSLTAGVTVTAGQVVYAGVLWNGTTAPVLFRAGSNAASNGVGSGLAANQRFGRANGTFTAPPSSITPASLLTADGPMWMAVA